MAEFYSRHFDSSIVRSETDRIVELRPRSTGIALLLHPAGPSQREGQVLVKLVFDVEDVPEFCVAAKKKGLKFGKVHQAEGYAFANAKDPSKKLDPGIKPCIRNAVTASKIPSATKPIGRSLIHRSVINSRQ